jgi:hypothetical protein
MGKYWGGYFEEKMPFIFLFLNEIIIKKITFSK